MTLSVRSCNRRPDWSPERSATPHPAGARWRSPVARARLSLPKLELSVVGGGGDEGRPVTSPAAGIKRPPPRSLRGRCPGAEWAVPVGDTRASLRLAGWEPRKAAPANTMPQNVVLPGPAPWGFRLSGGIDFNQPLIITRVGALRLSLWPKVEGSSSVREARWEPGRASGRAGWTVRPRVQGLVLPAPRAADAGQAEAWRMLSLLGIPQDRHPRGPQRRARWQLEGWGAFSSSAPLLP